VFSALKNGKIQEENDVEFSEVGVVRGGIL
jgi:hypothetical protein